MADQVSDKERIEQFMGSRGYTPARGDGSDPPEGLRPASGAAAVAVGDRHSVRRLASERSRERAGTLSVKQALAERDRLRKEQETAAERGRAAGERLADIERKLEDLEVEREQALQDQVLSGKPADLDGFDRREAELRREAERAEQEMDAAQRLQWQAVDSLPFLIHDQFGSFAKHADGLAEEAEKKMAKLTESKVYREAVEAWQAAASEWNGLRVPFNQVRVEREHEEEHAASDPAATVEAHRRGTAPPPLPETVVVRLSAVPACPLPGPGALRGVSPRPPEVRERKGMELKRRLRPADDEAAEVEVLPLDEPAAA